MNTESNDARDGVIAGLAAYLLWGILPVYFKTVGAADSLEVLTHRVIWAVPFGALILTFRHQWPEVRRALTHSAMLGWLSLSAFFIGLNWFAYIWAIQDERIFETSLGYYINPLVNMLFGVLFFGERLRRFQLLAVALAALGVLVLTVSGGEVPWIALFLALSFAVYAVIRKKVVIGGMPGLFVETVLLLPLALGWFLSIRVVGSSVFAAGDAHLTFWLMMAGPITALPLLCFALAARRLPLSTIGFMQFLAPTMQFATGVYYGEPLTTAHIICFCFIWAAVAIFVVDAVRTARKRPSQRASARA
ncbi:MAG: EamA family transporter RarD [Gammaproteobacteria bacterium]|nr:EamA family transporter RarD [Gammaproteobacteria bacterium]